MKNKITKELIEEQNKIILSESKKMLVLAGPGSGKTHTITQKAIRELKALKSEMKNKGVILCSYTRESSLELKQRLGSNIDDTNSFVGTFDSFIFNEILLPFANRILKSEKKDLLLNKNFEFIKTSFNSWEEVNVLTRQGITQKNKNKIKEYYNKWVSNFQGNIYELSFPSYLFSGLAIKKLKHLNQFINSKFNSIYIDEAQDLNYFQIWFLKIIINNTNLNCYLIGDDKQSIYSFRGAKPLLFLSMMDDGFEKYEITHSVRCHYNILEFAKRIQSKNNGNNILKNNNIININTHIEYIMLKELKNFFILTETNKEAELIYEKCIENGITDVIFSRGIELYVVDKSFSDNYYEIIEELLKFYLNHKNPIAKYAYPLENLISFLDPIVETKKLNNKNLAWENSLDNFIKKIFNLLKVNIDENILMTISDQMSKEIHINHYFKTNNQKRIMTIHSSKGLETENVFINLTRKQFPVDDEAIRKLFVAITRAKKKIFINFKGDKESLLEKYIINRFNNNFIP